MSDVPENHYKNVMDTSNDDAIASFIAVTSGTGER